MMESATKPTYDELLKTASEYREACCAAMRVLAEFDTENILANSFAEELYAIGIREGFGLRNDEVLRRAAVTKE
jgi:hypothetical protein